MPCSGFLWRIAVPVLLLLGAASAQEESPVYCGPKMLDVRVWPASEPKTATGAHLLVIEIRNRSSESCRLTDNLFIYPPNSNWNYYPSLPSKLGF